MLQRIIGNLMLYRDDVVILDMEAGLEHLGRGTTAGMNQFVVVIEPGERSVQTYHNIRRLAFQLGVPQVRVVANKIQDAADEAFVRSKIPPEDLLGIIHYNRHVVTADRLGQSPFDVSPETVQEILAVKERMETDRQEASR